MSRAALSVDGLARRTDAPTRARSGVSHLAALDLQADSKHRFETELARFTSRRQFGEVAFGPGTPPQPTRIGTRSLCVWPYERSCKTCGSALVRVLTAIAAQGGRTWEIEKCACKLQTESV